MFPHSSQCNHDHISSFSCRVHRKDLGYIFPNIFCCIANARNSIYTVPIENTSFYCKFPTILNIEITLQSLQGSPHFFLHFECWHCKMHTSEHGGHKLEHGNLHLNGIQSQHGVSTSVQKIYEHCSILTHDHKPGFDHIYCYILHELVLGSRKHNHLDMNVHNRFRHQICSHKVGDNTANNLPVNMCPKFCMEL